MFGAGVVLVAAVGAGLLVPQAASAATTCAAPPGTAAEVAQVEGDQACGATSDGTAGAWSHGDRGVGFADGRGPALVAAAGLDGGVGAAESTAGRLLAVGAGFQALALGVLDLPGTAFVLAGPNSQAYIGDADDPVLCEGELAAAFNLEALRGCLAVGAFRFVTPGAEPPAVDLAP
ncbi:hypothetical protein OED52_18645 [Rhodococcus sp. Z13]|uniref:Uncharacterized protein n=1 Tax=Rhodococcus sacchari TaxID=2962047 RepID=A0ACD4DF75_9NOCA|nr:DUF6764 family protein [Rhodococcus sp. Z13]UYP18634.1 hypothetical protein OED52_18645 [Rhodococcus sp. Z13]